MNILTRLAFVIFSIIGLTIFGWGFTTSTNLSIGQSLMLWSTVPASLMHLTAAFYTKKNKNEVIALMVMFVGIFFAMLSYGMYKLSGELAYGAFAWMGIMLCGTSVAMMTFYGMTPQIQTARG